MAKRSTRRTSRSTSRSGYSGRGYSGRKSGGASSRYSSSRKPARRRSGSRSTRAPQTVRIVLEHAGAAPVREGQQVDIGMKVAKAPRLKPRF